MGAPCFPQPNLWLARCASRRTDFKTKFGVLNIPSLCWCLPPVPPASAKQGDRDCYFLFRQNVCTSGSSSSKRKQAAARGSRQRQRQQQQQEAAAAGGGSSSSSRRKQQQQKQQQQEEAAAAATNEKPTRNRVVRHQVGDDMGWQGHRESSWLTHVRTRSEQNYRRLMAFLCFGPNALMGLSWLWIRLQFCLHLS